MNSMKELHKVDSYKSFQILKIKES